VLRRFHNVAQEFPFTLLTKPSFMGNEKSVGQLNEFSEVEANHNNEIKSLEKLKFHAFAYFN
jgi:hypothetical protein